MSSHWKELVLYIDGLFQRHNSQLLAADSLQLTGDILSKSKRFDYMKTLVDAISHPDLRNSTDFSKLLGITFERLFMLCSDECDDIRIYSEECLNRLTHNFEETDLPKVLRQIHLEMRRNGPHRSLRSALRRHAQLCEHVNPQFLRFFSTDLVPLLLLLSNRDEELIMEELIDSFGTISIHLARFFTSQNILDLMETWLRFLTMDSPIKRRVGANVLISLVVFCKNSAYYIFLLLKKILDILDIQLLNKCTVRGRDTYATSWIFDKMSLNHNGLVPEGNGKYQSVLGVLLCLRHLAPFLRNNMTETLSDSFKDVIGGTYMNETLKTFHFHYILQALVFVVHSSTCSHKNIVNASLDTLSVMLTNPHSELLNWLIHNQRPTIFQPILQSINMDPYSNICDVWDRSLHQIPQVTEDIFESDLSIFDDPNLSDYNLENIQQSAEFSCGDQYVSSTESSDSYSDDHDLRLLVKDDSSVFLGSNHQSILKGTHCDSNFELDSPSELNTSNCDLKLPCILDDDAFWLESSLILEIDLFPITRIIRRLCGTHLLSGIPGSLLYHGVSQISIQNSTINCLSAALRLKPELLLIPLFPLRSETSYGSNTSYICDVFLFISHPDPFTVEKILILSSLFIKHHILTSNSCSLTFQYKFGFRYILSFLLDSFIQLLNSYDGIHAKASYLALKNCIPELLLSCYGTLVLDTLSQFLYMRHHSFWLARIEFCNLLTVIDWKYVAILERGCTDPRNFQPGRLQKYVASSILPWLLMDEDPRVWESFHNVLSSLIQNFHFPSERSILFDPSEYFSSLYISKKILNTSVDLDNNLQFIIEIITNKLVPFESITNFMAALNALASIAKRYFPSKFPNSWGISFNMQEIVNNSGFKLSSYGILPFLYNQLFKLDIITDCAAHSNLLFLFNSLLKAGVGILIDFHYSLGNDLTFFHLIDKNLSLYCSQLFKHIIRILKMFDIIITRQKMDYSKRRFKLKGFLDEHQLHEKDIPFSKEKVKKSTEKSIRIDSRQSKLEDRTKTNIGIFSHIKSYVRLFYVLKKSYFGFQHSMNLNKDDRFCRFVKVILDTLCDLISCSCAFDLFSYTEEILSYLCSTFKILPSPTLLVIEQFISVLYGWNRYFPHSTSTKTLSAVIPITLHDILYFIPLNIFHKELFQFNEVNMTTQLLNNFPKTARVHHASQIYLSKTTTGSSSKKNDKNISQKLNIFSRRTHLISEKQIASASTPSQLPITPSFKHQIKLFEGILTRSLNVYSSSSLFTQMNIISLLTKLVMFQLNYSLIDSNSILLNKIFSQVGYIEQGFTFDIPSQISGIFQFLILISINKPDILPFSKIILHCESAISSGITISSISAVKPLVIYLYPESFQFNQSLEYYLRDFYQFCKTIKYTEHGHKDVIFTILIRLIQFPDIIEMLANILKSVQKCHVKWADVSLLIIGPLLQKIKRNQIQIDSLDYFKRVQDLIFNLHPSSTNRISLFFYSLHSIVELHSIKSHLSWIAIGLLVAKLSYRCYDEKCLFTEINGINLIFPRVDIAFIGVVDALQIGPNLSPQELIVQVIIHLSERSISLLSSLLYLSRTSLDLESSIHLLWNIISQLLSLMLWILKDNIFIRISSCMKLYIHKIITMYLGNNSCGESSLLHLQRMKNHFPILFLKLLHLCGLETSTPNFWNEVIDSIKNGLEICHNPLHRYIFNAIIFDLFTLTLTLSKSYQLELLKEENLAQVLLTFTRELSVNRFLSLLHSNQELSIFVWNQLKRYLLSKHFPFHIMEILTLFDYFHFSYNDDLLMLSEIFLNSKNHALAISFLNGLFGNYKSEFSSNNCQDSKTFMTFYNFLLFKGIQSANLRQYCHILNALTLSTSFYSRCPCILETEIKSLGNSFVRHSSPNWYLSKFREIDYHYNFFTMDCLKPLRCLNLDNLISLLNFPDVDLKFMYFIIESCKECIIDTISQVDNNEICDEDNNSVNISISQLLQQCSYSLFSWVDNYISNLICSSSDVIFSATNCLVSLFDSGLSLWKFVDFSNVNHCNLITFAFMHLQNVSVKPFLLTKIDYLIPALLCPSFILEIKEVRQICKDFHGLILSGIHILFDLIIELLGISVVNNIKRNFVKIFNCDEEIGKLNVLLTLLPTHITEEFIPSNLISPIGKLLLSLCNLDNFFSILIIPSFLWDETFGNGMTSTSFPQFSLDLIHDPETFFELMKRIATLGWRTKDQFEEIWSLILKVLVPSNLGECLCQEDHMEIMKTSCIAVEAVTTHLLTYLLQPLPGIRNPCYGLDLRNHGDSSAHFYYSRNGLLMNGQRTGFQSKMQTKPGEKVVYLRKMLEDALRQSMQFRKAPFLNDNCNRSIDRALDYVGYLTVQFSFPPFVTNCELERNIVRTNVIQKPRHDTDIKGWLEVNLTSCVRLLYDLYNNWVLDEMSSIPLMLYHSTMKSLLFISDLFTDESQIKWLLEFCLNLYRFHPTEDEILKVYINLAIFKTGSIIHKDSGHIVGIIDVLENGLLSSSPPLNISAIEGLIFLFQEEDCTYLSPVISKVSNFILTELENARHMLLYFHQQQLLVLISAGTELILHHKYLLKDQNFVVEFSEQLISYCSLSENDRNWNVLYSILYAFELLIITLSLQEPERAAILNLTLKLLTDGICSSILFCALSLLVTCMYLGDLAESLVVNYHLESLTQLEIDPMTHNIDIITQTRDKIALLLNIIHISGFLEARFTVQILHHILLDLLPSNQSMNTIIGVFLDENHPNVALIGWLMYKLFQMFYQRGQDKEVKVWALLCLSSFIQRRPVEYAIWNLTCLFVSISKDPNISNLLPFVLSRLGKVNNWDEDIFLTAGTSFYQILDLNLNIEISLHRGNSDYIFGNQPDLTREHDEKSQFTGCLNQYINLHYIFLRLLNIVKI